jgi:16S rRNA processing protein RimM
MTDPARPEGLLEVGRIGRPHGVRGDVHVSLVTDRAERVAPGARLWARGRWLTVESSRSQGSRWIVHFDGIVDRAGAERMTSALAYAEPIDDPDAVWVHELVGSAVVEPDGTARGRCVAVVANPADDLLELESGALVPVRFVVSCDGDTTVVDVPAGLFDLFDRP